MRNYPNIAQKIYNEPWLITKEKHRVIQQVFESHMGGEPVQTLFGEEEEEEKEHLPRKVGNTMIIPVHGVLGKHLSSLEKWCGGCSVDDLSAQIDAAEGDWTITQVAFDFRTPGGTVTGIPELGNKMASMTKDTIGFSDYECCSAGYWLASQTDRFYATESASVGSVGVWSLYLDYTQQMQDEGVKANVISAGKYKLAGAWFKEMTDEERAMLQAEVDGIHEKFKTAILSKRRIDAEFLEGQIYFGDEASDLGFTDGAVESLEELIR